MGKVRTQFIGALTTVQREKKTADRSRLIRTPRKKAATTAMTPLNIKLPLQPS